MSNKELISKAGPGDTLTFKYVSSTKKVTAKGKAQASQKVAQAIETLEKAGVGGVSDFKSLFYAECKAYTYHVPGKSAVEIAAEHNKAISSANEALYGEIKAAVASLVDGASVGKITFLGDEASFKIEHAHKEQLPVSELKAAIIKVVKSTYSKVEAYSHKASKKVQVEAESCDVSSSGDVSILFNMEVAKKTDRQQKPIYESVEGSPLLSKLISSGELKLSLSGENLESSKSGGFVMLAESEEDVDAAAVNGGNGKVIKVDQKVFSQAMSSLSSGGSESNDSAKAHSMNLSLDRIFDLVIQAKAA